MSGADRNLPLNISGHKLVQHARRFTENGNAQTEDGRSPGMNPTLFDDNLSGLSNGPQPIQAVYMGARPIIDNRRQNSITQNTSLQNMNNIQRSIQHRDYKKVADVNQYQSDTMHVMAPMPPLIPMHQAQQANHHLPPYDLTGNSLQKEQKISPQMSNEGAHNLTNGAAILSDLDALRRQTLKHLHLSSLQMKMTGLDPGNFQLALQPQVHQQAPPSNQVEQQLFTAQKNGTIANVKRTFRNVHSISNDQIPDSLPNIGHLQQMPYAHESTNSFISQSPANVNSVEHPIYDTMEPLIGLQHQSRSNCSQMQNEIAEIPKMHALCSESKNSTKEERKSRKKNKNEINVGDDDENNVGIHRKKNSDTHRSKPSNEEGCKESSLNAEVAIESIKPAGSGRTKRKYTRRKKSSLDAESDDVIPDSIPKEKRKYTRRKKSSLDAESNDATPDSIPKEKRKYTRRKKSSLDTESDDVIPDSIPKEKRKYTRRKKSPSDRESNKTISKPIPEENRNMPPPDTEPTETISESIARGKRKYTKRKKPALDAKPNVAMLELSTKEKRKYNRRKKSVADVEPNDVIREPIPKRNELVILERKEKELQPIRRRSRRYSSGNESSENKDGENTVCHFNSIDEKSRNYLEQSHSVMRKLIASVAEDYSNSPLGELWVKDIDNNKMIQTSIKNWTLSSEKQTSSNDYKLSLLGRRPIWDEGHFTDGQCHTNSMHVDQEGDQKLDEFVPPHLRAYCNCGRDHFEEDLSQGGQARRSGRSGKSVKMSRVIAELEEGNLNAHTLITCDEYSFGPEFRYLLPSSKSDKKSKMAMREIENFDMKDQIDLSKIQPFDVKVSPDVSFITDLHCHLNQSEVIGLLGGKYDEDEKILYIQAAFPCKSTERSDNGFTDVEMEIVSQIVVGEAIRKHGLNVVGWYHSHPTFQPDPSVTDIENQSNYQNLFSGEDHPFVGLIVGTYGSTNTSFDSIMRWFHVENKHSYNSSKSLVSPLNSQKAKFPMNLKVTYRNARKYKGPDFDTIQKAKIARTENGSKDVYQKEIEKMKKAMQKSLGISFSVPQLCVFVNSDLSIPPKKSLKMTHVPNFADKILSNSNDLDGYCIPYTSKEYYILRHPKISNDVKGAIIWNAVAREQIQTKTKVPSPDLILQRLYESKYFGDELVSAGFLVEDDAIIIHAVDAILHHYMDGENKINFLKLSNQKFDLSFKEISDIPKKVQEYLTATFAANSTNSRMTNGQKMVSSLLKWVGHMHLNYHGCRQSTDLKLNDSFGLTNDIIFLGEVIRLIAARWKSGNKCTFATKRTLSVEKVQPSPQTRKKRRNKI